MTFSVWKQYAPPTNTNIFLQSITTLIHRKLYSVVTGNEHFILRGTIALRGGTEYLEKRNPIYISMANFYYQINRNLPYF